MTPIDVLFPVAGQTIPTDHGYALYAALSRLIPSLHAGTFPAAVAPVRARAGGRGELDLAGGADLRVRVSADRLPDLLPLAGATAEIGGHRVRFGVPRVVALEPATRVAARLVVVKPYRDVDPFAAAVRRQLDALGVAGRVALTTFGAGPRAGEHRRRVVRVGGRAVVGFGVVVSELDPGESLRLQEHGLGGKRKMGCGFFLPVREDAT